MSNIKEVVRDMAKLTVLSGRINPVQEHTMRMYPFIVFDGVKSVVLDYDLSHPKDRNAFVHYDVTSQGEQKDLMKKCEYLEMAVRDLFWSDLTVKITINGRNAFESPDERE